MVPITNTRSAGRRPLLAAVAAAVVLLIGGIVVVSQNDSGVGDDDVVAVIEAPDAVTQVLAGDLGGKLSVTYSVSEDAIVVDGIDVPVLDEAETYQLWLVGDQGAVSAGLFRPAADGSVLERLDGVDPTGFVLGVTQEPAGGSDSPTLPIIAST